MYKGNVHSLSFQSDGLDLISLRKRTQATCRVSEDLGPLVQVPVLISPYIYGIQVPSQQVIGDTAM